MADTIMREIEEIAAKAWSTTFTDDDIDILAQFEATQPKTTRSKFIPADAIIIAVDEDVSFYGHKCWLDSNREDDCDNGHCNECERYHQWLLHLRYEDMEH